jgi:glycosyltransferase involved in cell wall biosynthesis
MKFLFHFYDLHQRAGIQRAICELSNSLVANGDDVVVVSGTERSKTAYWLDSRVVLETYSNPEPQKTGWRAWPAKVLWAWRQYSLLRTAVTKHQPTIVVDHGTALGLLYPLSRFGGSSFVLQRHFPGSRFPGGPILYRLLSIISSGKSLVVLTNTIAEDMRQLGFKDVAVIPNPVPTEASFTPYTQATPRLGLLLGRAGNPQKGFDIFVRALARRPIPDWRFLIVGPGVKEDPVLNRLLKESKLGNLVELRAASNDPYALIRSCACVIMPSRYEALPMVALEALSIGRPVIGSDVDGLRDVVQPGINGALFKSEDIADLSSTLLDITSSSDRLACMASQASATVAPYRPEAIAKLWRDYAYSRLSPPN